MFFKQPMHKLHFRGLLALFEEAHLNLGQQCRIETPVTAMDLAPDEVGGGFLYATAPAEAFIPEHLIGKLCCLAVLIYAGPEAEARRVLAPTSG